MNNIPAVTKNLIIINILIFFGNIVAARYGISLDRYLSLHFFLSDYFNPAQLFSYMFMHEGFSHLFFNMFALFMFGPVLEQTFGRQRYLSYYLICGIGAGIVQELVTGIHFFVLESGMSPDAIGHVLSDGVTTWQRHMNFADPNMAALNAVLNTSTVGASGAIFGVLLAFGMLYPNSQMFVFPLPMPVRAKYFVVGYALLELFLGLRNSVSDNVAHFAHLGGMLFGFIMIVYWRRKGRRHGSNNF